MNEAFKKPSLRSRRDRSRAQSFGLLEEKKPRREWGVAGGIVRARKVLAC